MVLRWWEWDHGGRFVLAVAEPRTFRYRILHIAGRLIRSARRRRLPLPEHWPWANDLLDAYGRLAAIT